MEQMIRTAKHLGQRLGRAYAEYFEATMLVSSLLSGLMGALLASYSPEEGISPFGLGCAAGAWYAGISPYFACLGAFIGYIAGKNYAYAAGAALLALSIFLIERRTELARVYRLLTAFAAELTVLTLSFAFSGKPFVFALGTASVSILCAVILGHGIRAAQRLASKRELADAELLALAASAGIVTLCFGNFAVLGQSPAMIFCGFCSLILAYRCGASSVAFAVTAAAGRVLVTGGDMYFIAVLSAAALIASSLRSVGKAAVMLGFAGTNLIFYYFMRGTALFSVFETAVCSLAFMLLPRRSYMPVCPAADERRTVSGRDERYNSLQYNISGLTEVLCGLARVYGGELGQMLQRVSDTLEKQLISSGAGKRREFGVEYGCASSTKRDSSRSGDSYIARCIGGDMLLCLSDGMGSGEAAGKQSAETVALLSDLITVGFDMQAASECINKLMALRAKDDMYATLDAWLIDLADGTARMIKLGAPPSYVVRAGKLYTLYAENPPVGIAVSNEAGMRRVSLKKGDRMVLMTDGAAEGLGQDLSAVLIDVLTEAADPESAAERILSEAKKAGARDDMTVLAAFLY